MMRTVSAILGVILVLILVSFLVIPYGSYGPGTCVQDPQTGEISCQPVPRATFDEFRAFVFAAAGAVLIIYWVRRGLER